MPPGVDKGSDFFNTVMLPINVAAMENFVWAEMAGNTSLGRVPVGSGGDVFAHGFCEDLGGGFEWHPLEFHTDAFLEVAIVAFGTGFMFPGASIVHVDVHVILYWVHDGFEFLIAMDGVDVGADPIVGSSDCIYSFV